MRVWLSRQIRVWTAVGHRLVNDDLMALAGGIAFNLLLSLFPGLIFVAALAGLIGGMVGIDNLFTQILDYLTGVMPPSAVETVKGPLGDILRTQSGGLLSIGILGALWAASGATASIMHACNRIYRVKETRPFWQHRLLIAGGLTIVLGILIMVAFLLILFGQQLGEWIASLIGAQSLFVTVWQILRWPVVLLALMISLAMLYWLGPNIRQPFRWLTPGSVLATLLWLIFTSLFGLYVANFGSYNQTYGAIAGVIILLLWLNYSGLVVLLGVVVDHVLGQERETGPAPGDIVTLAPQLDTASLVATMRPALQRAVPAWLPLAAVGLWSLIIMLGALRRR